MPTNRFGDHSSSGHLSRILDDKTPQLGGMLDGNGFTFNGAVAFEAKAGEALSKGNAVYVSGVSGNKPVVMKADADDAAKMPAFGIAETDASLNANVNVVTFGTVYEIDTSAYSAGDELYVSTTAGELTSTKPTGATAKLQNIGKVIRSHASAGSIKVGGAGRTNAVPNLDDGTVFIGDVNNQAEQRALVLADISDYTAPTETDPVYTASSWYTTTNNSSNWDTAYGWGNHASAGYLTSFTETDPVFTASAASGITSTNISNWNTAYGWGNHATQNYAVTTGDTFTGELALADSVRVRFDNTNDSNYDVTLGSYYDYDAWFQVKSGEGTTRFSVGRDNHAYVGGAGTAGNKLWDEGDFTSTNISNWNTAYGWGNHATAGYATSFNSLSAKDGGTGTYRTSGYLQSGTSGSGMVSLTTNDGGGNANVTFNHAGNAPDAAGYNTGRITVNVDATTGASMVLSAGTGGAAPNSGLTIYENRVSTAGRLDLADTNLQLSQNGSQLRITTASGYGGLGPQNTSYFHFTTDRSRFYFNKEVQFDGTGIRAYDASADARFPIYYDSQNTSYYCDPAGTSRLSLSYNDNTSHSAANGRGVRFWNSDSYKIWMSSATDATWGGSAPGADTSDYNMYFQMSSGGTNRGFVFRNASGPASAFAQIDGTGRAYFRQLYINQGDTDKEGLQVGTTYLDFKYGVSGGGGIRLFDADGLLHGYWYGDGNGEHGFLDNDGAWAVRVRTSTSALQLRCNNNHEMSVATSYVVAYGSSRAPVFYDSNNTGYYAHLDSTGDSIRAAGDIVAYYSDERLKDIEGNIPNALDKVCSLNGFYYRGNKKAQALGYDDSLKVGLSAQEVKEVLPEIIKDCPADARYMTVDYAKVVPLLVEAIKDLKAEIEELKK